MRAGGNVVVLATGVMTFLCVVSLSFSSVLGGSLSVEVTLAITLAAFAPTLVKSEQTYDLSAVTFECAITHLTNSASSAVAFSLALVETSLRMSFSEITAEKFE